MHLTRDKTQIAKGCHFMSTLCNKFHLRYPDDLYVYICAAEVVVLSFKMGTFFLDTSIQSTMLSALVYHAINNMHLSVFIALSSGHLLLSVQCNA